MPWPLVWFALYREHSYVDAFVLYHGLCLLAFWRWGCGRCQVVRMPLGWLAAAAVCVPVAVLVVHTVVGNALIAASLQRLGFVTAQLPWFLAYFLLLQPFAEEAFWRGTVYEGLRRGLSDRNALALSSVLFGSWHSLVIVMVTPHLWVLGTAVVIAFGGFMTWVYRMGEGQILPTAILHSLAGDLPLMIVMALAVR